MLSYSARSARAVGFLRSPFNDIEVYVEDPTKIRVWLALVRKHLEPGVRLQSVTPLGSRQKVIDACRADQAADGRRRIYIIDADYDLLLDRRAPRLSFLCRLASYSLEGLAHSKSAIAHLMHTYAPDVPAETAVSDFEEYLENTWGRHLRRLFFVYALNYLIDADAKTSSYHVVRLMRNPPRPRLPNEMSVSQRFGIVAEQVRQKGLPSAERMRKIRQRALQAPLRSTISGKTYFLPLISEWLSARARVNLTDDQIILAAIGAGHCSDRNLSRKIREQF